MDTIQKTIDASRLAAETLGFPPFIGPERESTPLNASPYVAHLDDLREGRFLSNRKAFVAEFAAAMDQLPAVGARPVAALLGGSAIGPKVEPGDLDAVVFYESDNGVDTESLKDLLKKCKENRLDLRAIPMDGNPVLMLKAALFFGMLYSKEKGSRDIVRGIVLIDCQKSES